MEIIFYLRILSLWRSVINKIPEYNDLNFSSNCLISPLRRYFIWASIEPFFFLQKASISLAKVIVVCRQNL